MAFWGVEVKPGKPITHIFDPARGRLRISQATLGIGVATKTSLVQCNVGDKSPVLLCALLPDKTESCHLDLEFEEAQEVLFSVIGPRSVHLTGFYLGNANGRNSNVLDDSESYGEDIANTDDESAPVDDEEYEDSFIDDDELEVRSASPVSSDQVTDDEIVDKKKPKVKRDTRRRLKKNYQIIESDDEISSQEKNVVNDCPAVSGLESEDDDDDDDDFPIFSRKNRRGRGEKPDKDVSKTVDKKIIDDSTHGRTDDRIAESKESKDQAVNTSDAPEKKSKKKRKGTTHDNKTAEAGDRELGLSPGGGDENGSKRKKRKKERIAEKTSVDDKDNDNALKEGKVKEYEGGTGDAGPNSNIEMVDLTFSNDKKSGVADGSQSVEKKSTKKKKSKIQENGGENHKVDSSKSRSFSNGLIVDVTPPISGPSREPVVPSVQGLSRHVQGVVVIIE